jgi:hypothetical protein
MHQKVQKTLFCDVTINVLFFEQNFSKTCTLDAEPMKIDEFQNVHGSRKTRHLSKKNYAKDVGKKGRSSQKHLI